jgi:hypothetical protein
MGEGCQSVRRLETESADFVVGQWSNGRVGTYRGLRQGKSRFGAVAFGTKQVVTIEDASASYAPLLADIVQFFRTGTSPVDPQETLELYAFLSAADESKAQNGAVVSIQELLDRARSDARAKLATEFAGNQRRETIE